LFEKQTRQQTQRLFELAGADPLLKPAVTGLKWGMLLRQLAPLRSGAEHPKDAVQHGTRVMPRTTAVVLATSRAKHRRHQIPLFFGQLPTSSHRRTQRSSEHLQNATNQSPWGIYETSSSVGLAQFKILFSDRYEGAGQEPVSVSVAKRILPTIAFVLVEIPLLTLYRPIT